jgi:hypothetical protein
MMGSLSLWLSILADGIGITKFVLVCGIMLLLDLARKNLSFSYLSLLLFGIILANRMVERQYSNGLSDKAIYWLKENLKLTLNKLFTVP